MSQNNTQNYLSLINRQIASQKSVLNQYSKMETTLALLLKQDLKRQETREYLSELNEMIDLIKFFNEHLLNILIKIRLTLLESKSSVSNWTIH